MSERLLGIRRIAPVIALIGLVLGIAVYLSAVRTPGGGVAAREWRPWAEFAVLAVLATSGAGIWMTAAWVSLYGRRSVLRVLAGPLLIVGCVVLGILEYQMVSGYRMLQQTRPVIAVFASALVFYVACFTSLQTARYLLGWRIIDESQATDSMPTSRFSLKSALFLTALAAILCAVVGWVAPLMRLRGAELALILLNFVCLPITWGLLLLAMISRLRMALVWPVAFVLAAVLAAVTTPSIGYAENWQFSARRSAVEAVFVPALAGYVLATCLSLVAASYLRHTGVLIRCGGRRGFGAKRTVVHRIPRRLVVATAIGMVLVTTSVGGWYYYQDWLLTRSPIPTQPTTDDLHRLMHVASHDGSRYDGPEESKKQFERRQSARDAIVRVGDDAVPFLLEQLTVDVSTDQGGFNKVTTASSLLQEIGRKSGFGEHRNRLIDTVANSDGETFRYGSWALAYAGADAVPATIEVLEAHDDRAQSAARVLERIGAPDANQAIPALIAACQAQLSRGSYSTLFSALVELAGSDALPSLTKALTDNTKYDLWSRASAAKEIGKLGVDGAVAVPLLSDLLDEVGSARSRRAPQDEDENARYREQLYVPILEGVAGIGPPAGSLAPRLIELLAAVSPDGELRKSVMRTLGILKAAEAVPVLESIAQEEARGVGSIQELAVVALGEIGPAAEGAVDTIEDAARLAAAEGWYTQLTEAAIVAKARIQMPQATTIIAEQLRLIEKELTLPNDGRGGYGNPGPLPYLSALVWLGANEDPIVMRHTASPSLNGDYQAVKRQLDSAVSSSQMSIKSSLHAVISESRRDSAAALDDRWTIDGKILALTNALQVGLEAEDAEVRAAAADILAAMGPLATSATAALHLRLQDDNPQVRMRVAAALVLAGDESENVKTALAESVAAVAGDDVPSHINGLVDDIP